MIFAYTRRSCERRDICFACKVHPENLAAEALFKPSNLRSRLSREGGNPETVLADALVCQFEWKSRTSANYPPLPPPTSRRGSDIAVPTCRGGKARFGRKHA